MLDVGDLARRWSELCGPSGREDEVRRALAVPLRALGMAFREDAVGNLVVHRPGPGRRLLVLVPMDEVGAAVTHVDEQGRCWLHSLGHVPTGQAVGRRLRFPSGVTGAVGERPAGSGHGEAGGPRLYLDLGLAGREEVLALVAVGDAAAFDAACVDLPKGALCGKALGSRAACAVAVAALQRLGGGEGGADLTVAFLAQSELGHRGVRSVVHAVDADMYLSLSPAAASDTPGARGAEVRVGAGPVTVVQDRGLVASAAALDAIAAAAGDAGATLQVAVGDPGTAPAGPALIAGCGAPAGALAFPLRHRHTTAEVCATADLERCVDVVDALVRRST